MKEKYKQKALMNRKRYEESLNGQEHAYLQNIH